MADPNHLSILEQGTSAWNAWRRAHPDVRPDLSGIDLTGKDLQRIDFSRADLRGAFLTVAEMEGADLQEAELTEANLTGTGLEKVVMRSARLTDADMSYATCTQIVLDEADLSGARLVETILFNASIRKANQEKAYMRETILTGANLEGSDMTDAILQEAITDGAIRDLDEMKNAGFKAIARGMCVGHGYSVPVEWNCPVEVFDREIQPGQLVHADKHGFLAIPAGDEEGLLEASVFMDQNECKTVIPAARSSSGLSTEELLRQINEAGAAFGEAATNPVLLDVDGDRNDLQELLRRIRQQPAGQLDDTDVRWESSLGRREPLSIG